MVVLRRALVLLAGATLAVAAAPACSGPKCGSSDLECFLDNIVIVPPQDGAAPQKLVGIPETKMPARPAATTSASPSPTPGSPGTADAGTQCPPGDAFCPGTGCTYTGGDPKNCGGCGRACDPRQICDNGVCQCRGDNPNCLAGEPPPATPTRTPPAITSQPDPIHFIDPAVLEPMNLPFTDPNGCQPAFCARLCRGKTCTSRSSCAPPVEDGLTSGVWRSFLGFLAEPPDRAEFTLGFTPISAPGCPPDLLDQVAAGTIVADVGPEATIAITVPGESPSTSTGSSGSSGTSPTTSGGPGTYCSPAVSGCSCALQACSDGDDHCWYETGHGRFTCSGCNNCNAAAQAAINSCCPHP